MRRLSELLAILPLVLLLAAPVRADLLGPEYSELLERWVLIDTEQRRAAIYQGNVAIAEFEHIAIGSRGTSQTRLYGDKTTPLGEFRIDRINRTSRFHIFLGIDYPRLEHADRALEKGMIDTAQYWDIFDRMLGRRIPPQDTALGGHIGIHGLGRADPETHRLFDWTRGCVAVTNEEIERLAALVSVGTRVVIR